MGKRIRSVELSDVPEILDIYGPSISDGATSFEAEVPDVSEMEDRVQGLRRQFPWLVFEANGRVLGYAYASPHRTRYAYRWCVDVSVYVHTSARNFGVGRALYTALFEILRSQGYVNAYAGITLPNPASLRLHESMGFAPIGVYPRIGFKFGRWHDVEWLHLRLQDPLLPENRLVPSEALLRQERIRAILRESARRVSID